MAQFNEQKFHAFIGKMLGDATPDDLEDLS